MIDLYAYGSPNVVKIIIALEEMDLPYALKPVELMGGANFEAGFLALNPLGKVPVLVDHAPLGGGDRRVVFESGAILLYLAEKTGRFMPTTPEGRSDAIQWLMVQMANVGPSFGQAVHFSHYAPAEAGDYGRRRFLTQSRQVLDVLEARLGKVAYIAGADYSITDMAFAPWVQAIDFIFGQPVSADYPNLLRWRQALEVRPAVSRAATVTAKLREQLKGPQQASPEVLERFFGRGAHDRSQVAPAD